MRFIVHVGPGSSSLPELEDLLPEERHYCFDPAYGECPKDSLFHSYHQQIDFEKVKRLKQAGIQFIPQQFSRSYFSGYFPFDEVRIHNVFNSGLTPPDEILVTALWLLRDDGSIYVGADQTPQFFCLREMNNLIHGFGVELEVLVHTTEKGKMTEAEASLVRKYMGKNHCRRMSRTLGSYLVRVFGAEDYRNRIYRR